MSKSDISVAAFLELRKQFFDKDLSPIPFSLRPKVNTQDDPLDEHIADNVFSKLEGIKCMRSGALTSPDLILYTEKASELHPIQLEDPKNMLGMELKKTERNKRGTISRASCIDFNSTPPCGTMIVYNQNNETIFVSGSYLFMCLEPVSNSKKVIISSLALVDGNLLNDDFDFYLSIVGERKKQINLGSYGDGMNRARPMLGFPNPLGIEGFDHTATLIHSSEEAEGLVPVAKIERTRAQDSKINQFYCHRFPSDVTPGKIQDLKDPFNIPEGRSTKTNRRGKFKLDF